MPKNPTTLFPGLLPVRGDTAFSHAFGGHRPIAGADCPNCRKPLPLLLDLDLADPRLTLRLPAARLPLLYCMRCPLSFEPFAYEVVGTDAIRVRLANRGEPHDPEWAEEVGRGLPKVPVALLPVPDRLQAYMHRLNTGRDDADLSPDECRDWNMMLDRHPSRAPDAINQVGGRSFLVQRQPDPRCPTCGRSAPFLVSLYSDESLGVVVAPLAAQVTCSFCARCKSVIVEHRI